MPSAALRRSAVLVAILTLLLSMPVLSGSPPTTTDPNTDATTPVQAAGDYVYVTLATAATATAPGLTRTRSGKLDLGAPDVRDHRSKLANERQQLTDWLRRNARKAEVLREYDIVLNAVALKLNGTSRSTVAGGPNVTGVVDSPLYRPSMNVSVGLVRADQLPGFGSSAGAGVKVGIIDTGIKEDHPFIGTAKVVIERVYCSGCPGVANDDMWSDHGTHVAGTVAGRHNTTATVSGVAIPGLSGMAPGASLGDYNVFPAAGGGFIAFGGSAFSHDIARALEDAVLDGMDVVNMSIGGGVQGPRDLLAEATDATVAAGVVAAVAAGNSGPGDSTVESPGSAERAITAGASTNPHFVGIPVTRDTTTVGAALGEFNNFGTVTASYTVTSPANGCTTITTALAGKIALIDRGVCTFTTKVRNAQNAGAVGVLVVNNVAGDPTAMAHDGTSPFPTIPAAMLGKNEGNALKPSGTVTVDGTAPREFITANADIIAGFSSRGPTPFTFLIKPDVTAPGVNVLSSTFVVSDWAFFQGTSMATPHVAGAAALLRWLHPDWTTDQVKSALMTRASRTVTDHVNGTTDPGVLARGSGRIDLVTANSTNAFFAPASVSFGLQAGRAPISVTRTVSYSGPAIGDANVTIVFTSAQPSGLQLTRTVSGNTITITLTASNSVPSGDHRGDIKVTVGGQTHLLPFWTRIDRKA
jgi:minor extracellular serine protease Vpr